MLFSVVLSSTLLLLLNGAKAQIASNWTSTGCVSSSGFDSCFNTASDKASSCLKDASSNGVSSLTCSCQLHLDELNCALENCWNEVYSCQYQQLVVRYLQFCPSASASANQFPFYPAPDNAPGGCSCNLGYVYDNITNVVAKSGTCQGNSFDAQIGCVCCAQAGAYTSIFDICPNTNPHLIGLDTVNTLFAAFDEPFDQCDSYLTEFDCVKSLGYSPIGTISSYIHPSATASAGTGSLTTTAGSITSPISGSTFVWTAPASNTYTVVAAQATNSKGSASGSSSSGSATGNAPSASSTGKNGASTSQPLGVYLYITITGLVGYVLTTF